jgi:hypothetical protein
LQRAGITGVELKPLAFLPPIPRIKILAANLTNCEIFVRQLPAVLNGWKIISAYAGQGHYPFNAAPGLRLQRITPPPQPVR